MTVVDVDERAGSVRFLFAEWSCAEGSDPADFENWKVANPSLGVKGICPVSALEEDFTLKMDIAGFAREHLGMWDDPRMSSVIPFESWDACKIADLDDGSQPVVDVLWTVAGVDVDPDQQWASIVLAGRREDGRAHLEVVMNELGVKWLVPTMQRLLSSSLPPRAVVVQAGAAAGMFGPEFEQIGLKVYYFGAGDIGRATSQFYADVVAGGLTHLDDPFLLSGLGAAAKYPIGKPELEQWGWLRKSRDLDITGIVACSYANRILTLESAEETLSKKKRHRML